MIPVSVEQIVKATEGVLLTGVGDLLIENVIIDSREETSNALFVPIIGEKTDGHNYVSGALKSGATALFMQKDTSLKEEILGIANKNGAAVISVADTVTALQKFAAWYRDRFDIPVVGITGSVGKTTTKEMIAVALGTEKRVLKTIGNKNSQIGLPLMMFCLDESYDIAVIEMGMSEVGEMKNLSAVAKPECAVMTNIGVAHIAQLGSQENIRKEKLNIVNQFSKGSDLFVNGNDRLLNEIATQISQNRITIDCDSDTVAALENTRVISYGIGEGFDYSAEQIVTNEKGVSFTVCYMEHGLQKKLSVHLKVYGNHNVLNALAAIAVAGRFGISPERAAEGLSAYEPIAMRGQIKKSDGVTWIDDTYNASPDSMKSGVQVLLSLEGKRSIAVLADVLELGNQSEELHRNVGAYLAEFSYHGKKTDCLVTVGSNAAFIADEAEKHGMTEVHLFKNNAEASAFLKSVLRSGDVVLVKGSRGMKTEEILNVCMSK